MNNVQVYTDIDWDLLWKNARERKSWTGKTAKDWDKKAPSFAKRNNDSPYSTLFISRLPLSPSLSVLDFGSGPGTLALPLSSRVNSITAVDYSKTMLDILDDSCQKHNISNITTVHGAWEDNWDHLGLGTYDITIASRSMGVEDLRMAITKLNNHSHGHIVVTDRIAPSPFDPEAFKAIGRDFESGPDYIYTLNTLYNLGIHASVDILQLEQHQEFKSEEDALNSYRWMFRDLSSKEDLALTEYVTSRIIGRTPQGVTLNRPHPPKWAMISWKKQKDI